MDNSNQIILYGAPGTGKSHNVKKFLEEHGFIDDEIKVVFHNDYTYSDFVGYISPSTRNEGKELEYNFVPGPFTIALEKALANQEKCVYLTLEELNRGNTASIFGDIFQLLDRDAEGQSEYPITNISIRNYLNTSEELDENIFNELKLGENEISIPSNLKIVCTMNTADQNVFTIDTAFKRRFKMEYVPIDFKTQTDVLKELDRVSKQYIFNNQHTWSQFAQKVNDIIDEENKLGFVISEDKKLGQYFVEVSDVSSKQFFCDKVIYYLKNDVFKYNDKILNESYETIYKRYVIDNEDIFEMIE